MNYYEDTIGGVSCLIYGPKSDRVFLFIYGAEGSEKDAEVFAENAVSEGWQVIVPKLGSLITEAPDTVIGKLKSVYDALASLSLYKALRADDIGCFYSMAALGEQGMSRIMFVSPVLDPLTFCEYIGPDFIYSDLLRKYNASPISASTEVLYSSNCSFIPGDMEDICRKNKWGQTANNGNVYRFYNTPEDERYLHDWELAILFMPICTAKKSFRNVM